MFKRLFWPLAFLFLITLIIKPWRISVSQDDATYASQVLSFLVGKYQFHPDSTAFLLPQTLIGTVFLKFFWLGHPIAGLNFLTWIVFAFFALYVKENFKLSLSLWISFISVPYWFQYGASFLYDIWAVFFVTFFLHFEKKESTRYLNHFLLFFLSFALPLQQQVLFVLPFFYFLKCILESNKKKAFLIFSGLLCAALTYAFLDKSASQIALPIWIEKNHQNLLDIFFTFFQLVFAIGFFLLPFAKIEKTKKSFILIGCMIYSFFLGFLYILPVHILACGVFFSDYLPRIGGAFLASIGFWGLYLSKDLFKSLKINKEILVFFAVFLGLFVNSFRGVADLRYSMIYIPIFIFLLLKNKSLENRLGSHWSVAFLLCFASLFLNSYQLDTTEQRWLAAQKLMKKKVPANEISAGYGRDHFFLEWSCIKRYMEKYKLEANSHKFLTEVYAYVPRFYEKNWIPHYIIKPSSFFGKKIYLKTNRKLGQDFNVYRKIKYRSFGVQHELSVYKNHDYKNSDCFE